MEKLLEFVKQAIRSSLIAEVSATPKPGLVDLCDSGAHRDMDYHTFAASAAAITPCLLQMFEAGLGWTAPGCLTELFAQVRQIGVAAEQAMYAATNGINTHKGMIFSMGTVAAAAGQYYQQHRRFDGDELLILSGRLCQDAVRRDLAAMAGREPQTHGEVIYARYGYPGIRGEAADGFPSVRQRSFPYLKAAMNEGGDDNLIHLNTLFQLMAGMDDTNVLIRTNPDMLRYMQEQAGVFLRQGGAFGRDAINCLKAMNQDFIKKNISPGGCADLLAVTIFLWRLEQYGN